MQDLNASEESRRALYAAFASGDPRFDGRVFVGVSSTGIYCRSVCTAKMPKYENCTFYRTAAEAEAAGFRPCLTCRPETAPGLANVDARASLARRAAALIQEECSAGAGVERLAARLGYTDRHLRRAFAAEYGVTPSQYAQTCRLLLAKSLLTSSRLPIAQVAEASGFGSVRSFNRAFKEHYRLSPADLRKRAKGTAPTEGVLTVHVGYRPPYRFGELLEFFAGRAIPGVELVEGGSYARTVRIGACSGWLRVEEDPARSRLAVTMSDGLVPVVPQVVARVRRMFDTACDPTAIAEGLAAIEDARPGALRTGTRLPGCFEPFETACRAVLGQQVSVAAASKMAGRIVESYGARVDTGIDGLVLSWPTPAEVLAIGQLDEAFGSLGVIRTRSRCIASIAALLEDGTLDLGPAADASEQIETLLAVKGIGPWTANYIAMRALSYPDAFLEGDAGVAHALPGLTPKERLELAVAWRPWRSYAVVSLWNSLA